MKEFSHLTYYHKLPGILAAIAVLFIWSGWLIVSKIGAHSSLTTFDFMAIRYGISSIVALPILLYYKPWQHMRLKRIVILTFLLGPFYTFCVFNAFNYAPASHGGIFMNGSFPVLTIIIGIYFFKEFPVKLQLLGIVLILFGAILSMIDGSIIYTKESWIGDLLFFVAAIYFAFYLTLCRLWNVSLLQVVMCSSIFNGALYVPIWFFFFNSISIDQDLNGLYLQLVYQGLVPNLLGLLLLAISVRYIGPNPTAAILAGVPSMGIFLGFFLLGENIGFFGILGLIIITPGILIVALTKSKVTES